LTFKVKIGSLVTPALRDIHTHFGSYTAFCCRL